MTFYLLHNYMDFIKFCISQMMKSDDTYQPPSYYQSVLVHLRLNLPLFECHGTVQTSFSLTFILSRVRPDPVCYTGNFLKPLFGLCEFRYCGHNTPNPPVKNQDLIFLGMI